MTDFPAVIGIGASAGGVEALIGLFEALPGDLPAPVLVVLHVAPSGTSVLAGILDRRTPLVVSDARHGQALEAGHVYVAQPDRHLRLVDGAIRLDAEPRVNGHRPAVDPLLRSIADAYGDTGVGVVLSGTRDDGTLGLRAVKAAGGHAFVQDPAEALYPSMPENAMRYVDVDGRLAVRDLAGALVQVATGGAGPRDRPGPARVRSELTQLTCPDCGGAIWHEHEGSSERYRCHVGHEYAPDSFDTEQQRQLEFALWAAVRALEDRVVLLEQLERRATDAGNAAGAERHRLERDDARRRTELIRDVIAPDGEPPSRP